MMNGDLDSQFDDLAYSKFVYFAYEKQVSREQTQTCQDQDYSKNSICN